jgi:hypothetical protein
MSKENGGEQMIGNFEAIGPSKAQRRLAQWPTTHVPCIGNLKK